MASSTAGSRRLAYQCLRCLHRDEKTTIDAKYRIEHHFLVRHMALDQVPFHCKLCQFRTFRKEDLERHVTTYPRHRSVLNEKGVKDTPEMLVSCSKPYRITEKDIMALSPEESRQHWQAKKRPDIMQQAIDAALLDDVTTADLEGTSNTTEVQSCQSTSTPEGRPPTPGVQKIIEMNQILQPLQQLASLFGANTVVTGATTSSDKTEASAQPLDLSKPPTPVQPPPTPVQPPPTTPRQAAKDIVPLVEPAGSTRRAPSPVPSLAESAGILNSMPTREECRALARSKASSSGSSDLTSASACGHHEQILKEIRELRETVYTLQDHFLRQYGGIHELATKLLAMAGQLAAPAQRQAPVAPYHQLQQGEATQPPPYVPTEIRRQNRAERPDKENRRPEHRERERSPLRNHGGKENRHRRSDMHRRDDRRSKQTYRR